MRWPLKLIVLLVAVVAIGVPAWIVTHAPRIEASSGAHPLSELQALAERSCRCERASGDTHACWRSFERLTGVVVARDEVEENCAPIRRATLCRGEQCVVTRYDYAFGTAFFCSSAEAGEAEAVSIRYIKIAGDPATGLLPSTIGTETDPVQRLSGHFATTSHPAHGHTYEGCGD